ncbi:MAG: hypothetical protein E7277_03100 [Lachnospiraceae bacterium]|nr:hypothetical protein [Lachnospiraceae bacterium]
MKNLKIAYWGMCGVMFVGLMWAYTQERGVFAALYLAAFVVETVFCIRYIRELIEGTLGPLWLMAGIGIPSLFGYVGHVRNMNYENSNQFLIYSVGTVCLIVAGGLVLGKVKKIAWRQMQVLLPLVAMQCFIVLPMTSYMTATNQGSEQCEILEKERRYARITKYYFTIDSENLEKTQMMVGESVYKSYEQGDMVEVEFYKDVFGNRFFYVK